MGPDPAVNMKSFLKFSRLCASPGSGHFIDLRLAGQNSSEQPKRERKKFTPADKSKIELGSVPLLERLNEEYTHIADTVVPSVVSITTMKNGGAAAMVGSFGVFFLAAAPDGRNSTEQQVTSLGSGVIVSREGHIVTNNHVVNGNR